MNESEQPRSFYRLRLGKDGKFVPGCIEDGFAGVDFDLHVDLSHDVSYKLRGFNDKYVPWLVERYPNIKKVSAGLACGMTWSFISVIKVGDILVVPDHQGFYRLCEVTSDYFYFPEGPLPTRRKVRWLDTTIPVDDISPQMRATARVPLTLVYMNDYRAEIEGFLNGQSLALSHSDPEIQDVMSFAMESGLEDFLVANWASTVLGRDYDIWSDSEGNTGKQYALFDPAGRIDILAIKKDKSELLVVELKRGRSDDVVVGQCLRYMGQVKSDVAEPDQAVRGVIISLSDSPRMNAALSMVSNITFYRYEIDFRLVQ